MQRENFKISAVKVFCFESDKVTQEKSLISKQMIHVTEHITSLCLDYIQTPCRSYYSTNVPFQMMTEMSTVTAQRECVRSSATISILRYTNLKMF